MHVARKHTYCTYTVHHRQTDRQTDGRTDRRTDGQTADEQTDRLTDRRTDHTNTPIYVQRDTVIGTQTQEQCTPSLVD